MTSVPSKAPISVFSWGTNGKGIPRIFDVFSSGTRGVMVCCKSSMSDNIILTHKDQSMEWFQREMVQQYLTRAYAGRSNYTSLATNSNALAYAVVNSTIWEFGLGSTNKDWVAIGKVWP